MLRAVVNMTLLRRTVFLLAGLCLGLPAAVRAGHADDHLEDHEQARQALAAGQVLPLRVVLDRLARDFPGEVLEVELEREGERWLYEVKLLRPDGALIKLKLDARDGSVLRAKGRR